MVGKKVPALPVRSLRIAPEIGNRRASSFFLVRMPTHQANKKQPFSKMKASTGRTAAVGRRLDVRLGKSSTVCHPNRATGITCLLRLSADAHPLLGSTYAVCVRGCRDSCRHHRCSNRRRNPATVSRTCLSINSKNRKFPALSPLGA
jgi:hypothetical protein